VAVDLGGSCPRDSCPGGNCPSSGCSVAVVHAQTGYYTNGSCSQYITMPGLPSK